MKWKPIKNLYVINLVIRDYYVLYMIDEHFTSI